MEDNKLNILVAIDEHPDDVWERISTPAQLCFTMTGGEAHRLLTENRFDLVFVDLHLTGMDSLALLRHIRTEKLCDNIILTSASPSFSYAQQGILYGVAAYLLRPLQLGELDAVIRKTRFSSDKVDLQLERAVADVVGNIRLPEAEKEFLHSGEGLVSATGSAIEHSIRWREFYERLIEAAFRQYPWLRLYHHPTEYASLDYVQDSDGEMVINFCRRKVCKLSQSLRELLPLSQNQKLEDILTFLLKSIDENIQQKDVAERYFITNSTLSTRFQRNLGMSYREYMTILKIRRGQYLLRYTDIRHDDLAQRLGYKDKDHFAKLFFQRTGQTIQECSRRNWGEYNI